MEGGASEPLVYALRYCGTQARRRGPTVPGPRSNLFLAAASWSTLRVTDWQGVGWQPAPVLSPVSDSR